MISKITGGNTTYLFTEKILNKYDIKYFRCNDTNFIQTEEPYWLNEAYSSAITQLDIGLPYRNIQLSEKASKIIARSFNRDGKFLDYAGGYGLFTRLMRDNGFDFYHTDKYCQNLFAKYFDLSDMPDHTRFQLTTAFEVFEHLVNPVTEINEILRFSDHLIFTTELQPNNISTINDWWYFAVETGQHISFYTEAALQYIGGKLGYYFYTDGQTLHLFTKEKFDQNPLLLPKDGFLKRKAKKLIKKKEETQYGQMKSLLMQDYDDIKNKLNK